MSDEARFGEWPESTVSIEASGAIMRNVRPPKRSHEVIDATYHEFKVSRPNPSGIAPFEFKVVVRPDDSETETLKQFKSLAAAGFKMADDAKERHDFAVMTGTLVALSPVAFTYETFPEGTRLPQPGDRVAFAKYAGFMLKGKDGVDYRVVNDKDIAAVLDY